MRAEKTLTIDADSNRETTRTETKPFIDKAGGEMGFDGRKPFVDTVVRGGGAPQL